eukprot:1283058-Rhodomonas_salina.1
MSLAALHDVIRANPTLYVSVCLCVSVRLCVARSAARCDRGSGGQRQARALQKLQTDPAAT